MSDNELKLEAYIEAEFREIAGGNNCEHRPTPQSQLDTAEERIRLLYDRGLEVQDTIGIDDLCRCMSMSALDNKSYGSHDLVEITVFEQRVIVPRYVGLIKKMRTLRAAIL